MNPDDTPSCAATSTAGPSAHAPESVAPVAAVPGTPSPVPDAEWERSYAELSEWHRAHGHLRVPVRRLATRKLAAWMETQRERARQRTLLRVEHERLSALGFDWTPRDAQWEHWLDRLRAFHREHGHVEVPDDFPQEPELGQWAGQIRKQHREGLLTPQEVRTLDSLGFRWDSLEGSRDARWEARFAQLIGFREQHGHCNVPAKWPEHRGFASWVHHQREFRKKGLLSAARIERLEGIGFQWQSGDWRGQDREAHLAKMLAALEAFRAEHGHTEVPAKYPPNRRLGKWVHVQRAAYNDGLMSPQRKARLDALGFAWEDTRRGEAERWETRYAQLVAFRQRFGHCWVTAHWDEDPGFGHWVDNQRLWKRLGKLSPERIARLEALGIEWPLRRRVDSSTWSDWDEMFAHLRAFHAAHGHTEVPPSHREPPGLGKWVHRQRRAVRCGELRAERRAQLEAIGFPLHSTRRGAAERWERRFAQLVAFRERFGHCRVTKQWREDSAFGHWVDNQRLWNRLGKLSPERIARLEGLGIEW